MRTRGPDDQDPILDHAHGTKTALAANTVAQVIVPPAGAKYLRISATADTFVRTDGVDPGDAAGSILILGGVPAEVIPVVAGVAVKAFSAVAGTVRAVPFKSRA
jgi:hypothetical protein